MAETNIVPAGDQEDNAGDLLQNRGPRDQAGTDSQRKQAHIPDHDQCMRALGQLPGLVAMKILTPSQSNAIRSVYQAILNEHGKTQAGRQGQLPDDNLLEIYRKNPDILGMLEPLLTNEQIKTVMEKAQDGGDGKA